MKKDFDDFKKCFEDFIANTDSFDNVEYLFWLADYVNDKFKIIESATGIKHGLLNTLINKILWVKKSMEDKKNVSVPNKMVVERLISELEDINSYLTEKTLIHTNEEIDESKLKLK